MTNREALEKRKLPITISLWIILPTMIIGLALSEDSKLAFNVIGGVGITLIAIIIIVAMYRLKCLSCNKEIFQITMGNPWTPKISKKYKCCPYCCDEFDSEI